MINPDFVASIRLIEETELKWECIQKKGDTHKVFKIFPYPHFETEEYKQAYFKVPVYYGWDILTDDEIPKRYENYFVRDNKVYEMPHIIIRMRDESNRWQDFCLNFKTYDSALKRYEELQEEFKKAGLIECIE